MQGAIFWRAHELPATRSARASCFPIDAVRKALDAETAAAASTPAELADFWLARRY